MVASVDIFADLVISFDGENLNLKAEKDCIVISAPTFRSSIRTMLRLREHNVRFGAIDAGLTYLGLSLYIKTGRLSFPLLGVKGNRLLLSTLLFIGRIGKWLGAE